MVVALIVDRDFLGLHRIKRKLTSIVQIENDTNKVT